MKKTIPSLSILLLLAAGLMTVFAFRVTIREKIALALRPELPVARPFTPPPAKQANEFKAEPKEDVDSKNVIEVLEIPEAIEVTEEVPDVTSSDADETAEPLLALNHGVPFSPQAPHANWRLPYQEACEETSLIMVNAWMVGTPSGQLDPDIADKLILELVAWQEERFGYYEDTTVEETAIMAREYYGYVNTEVLPVTSIEDVKREIASGYAVILPAAGAQLQNPYFRGEGPLYHMIVAKGFTEDGDIIANDPGTRRGEDYLYDPDVLFNAIGDWNDGNPAEGEKLMIVLKL